MDKKHNNRYKKSRLKPAFLFCNIRLDSATNYSGARFHRVLHHTSDASSKLPHIVWTPTRRHAKYSRDSRASKELDNSIMESRDLIDKLNQTNPSNPATHIYSSLYYPQFLHTHILIPPLLQLKQT